MSTIQATSPDLRALQDRLEVADLLYKYASAIDSFDRDGVRSVFADDACAEYGNLEPVDGADAIVEFIFGETSATVWQHHFLSVYHVNLDGDTAGALSYLTSHQVFHRDVNAAKVLVARYHDELTRTATGWKISKKVGEFLWAELRASTEEALAMVGGRGPKLDPWHRDLQTTS